jgi:octaprenyl-diphosphate synthase
MITLKTLEEIKAPIEKQLEIFEERFEAELKSQVSLLDTIMRFVIKRKGKQVRPLFIFLSAEICGKTNDATYHAASLIEMLHTATLIHDDVVDDSMQRRGFFSLNALWGNKVAVLIGDYLLSKGLLLSLKNGAYQMLHICSDAIREMSEGELLQIEKARRLDIKEEIYFEIIRKKTASLIASACAAGAASAGASDADIEKMRLLGEKIGIAFQIRDDLFDFGDGDAGKPQGNDIQEKKMTLPLIHALNSCYKNTRSHIIKIIKNENTNPKKIHEVTEFVINSPGIAYTRQKMNEFRDDAITLLRSFPESDARTAMEDLVLFVTERKK